MNTLEKTSHYDNIQLLASLRAFVVAKNEKVRC